MEKKIGILIPMYNSEKYIENCLKSVINQTYTNLEIIIINDGSTDKSLEICDKIICDDKRFKIYTRENRGVAFTRNELIKKCTSNYFIFLDSDDYIEKDYIKTLMQIIEKYDVDMVVSQIILYNKKKRDISVKTDIIDNKEALKKLLYNHRITHGPICKLYKKEVFENIQFPNGKIYEDLGVMYKIIDKCKKIALTNYQGYNYVYNRNSITKSKFSNDEISMLKYGEQIFEYVIKEYGEELLLPALNVLVEQSIELGLKIPLKKEYRNEIGKVKGYIKTYRIKLLKSKETYPRIKLLLFSSFLGIRVMKIIGKGIYMLKL